MAIMLPSLAVKFELTPAMPNSIEEFSRLVRQCVSPEYPGTEPGYGRQLFRQHLGQEKLGPNSLKRTVWCFTYGDARLGYSVATEKRGGRVKIGPLLLTQLAGASQRVGQAMLAALDEHYSSTGFGSLYGTFPSVHRAMSVLCRKSGWDLIAEVPGLYRDDCETLVSKKLSVDSPIFVDSRKTYDHYDLPEVVEKRGKSRRVYIPVHLPPEYANKVFAEQVAVTPRGRVVYTVVNNDYAAFLDSSESYSLDNGTALLVWRR